MSETPEDKRRVRSLSLGSAELTDLFRRYTTPPSSFHEAVQQAAKEAGWIPPWDPNENSKQRAAGKKSGIKRGLLAEWRRTIVQEAYKRLKPTHRTEPYSDESVRTLIEEYRNLVAEGCKGNPLAPPAEDFITLLPGLLTALPPTDQQAFRNVGRETLLKDMKSLGIRSKRGKQRPG